MRTRLRPSLIVDAFGERQGEVILEDGLISADAVTPCERELDLAGLVLMPAFVDTHCHLRDPGYPMKETMETGMRAALRGGYATLCAMANTLPVTDTAEAVRKNHEKARALSLCRLMQAGAAGVGLSDEIPTDRAALARETRVISNDGRTIMNADFMEKLLLDSAKYGFIISTHCQPERATVERDIGLLSKIQGQGHLHVGRIHVGRIHVGRIHVGHISRAETAYMIRHAKAEGLPITCEVMPHHLFGWDNPYKVNPPMRTRADVDALIEAIADGTVDCLATDHAPHTEADKAAGAAGISNIEHAAAIFSTVFRENGLPLTLMSRLMSLNPSRLLGLGTGRIAAGEAADIVAFDPNEEWTIDPEDMISRSHNTPFGGMRVTGRVKMTMVGGRILYDNR